MYLIIQNSHGSSYLHLQQVQSIHPYVAKQADELSLEVSDVVNVLKKMSDGECH